MRGLKVEGSTLGGGFRESLGFRRGLRYIERGFRSFFWGSL